jgi:hypothetical protein
VRVALDCGQGRARRAHLYPDLIVRTAADAQPRARRQRVHPALRGVMDSQHRGRARGDTACRASRLARQAMADKAADGVELAPQGAAAQQPAEASARHAEVRSPRCTMIIMCFSILWCGMHCEFAQRLNAPTDAGASRARAQASVRGAAGGR